MRPVLLLLAALALTSSAAYRAPETAPRAPREPTLSIYEAAELATGAPAAILKGIAFAESSEGRNLNHPNKLDRGMFGLSERWHEERAAKWGAFDPDDPREAAVIAGRIYCENLRTLGDEDSAIAAHLQGAQGVRNDGPARWYIERVRSNG